MSPFYHDRWIPEDAFNQYLLNDFFCSLLISSPQTSLCLFLKAENHGDFKSFKSMRSPFTSPPIFIIHTLFERHCVGYGKLLSILTWSHDGREKTLCLWHARVFNCSLVGYCPLGCKELNVSEWWNNNDLLPERSAEIRHVFEACSLQGHACKSELVPSPAMEPAHLPM